MRSEDITTDNLRMGGHAGRLCRLSAALGIAGLGAAALVAFLIPQGGDVFSTAYLVSFVFYLSLALGALFFVLLQHLTGAGWSVVVRRPAEAVAGLFPLLAILSIPLLFGLKHLYPWAGDHAMQDPVLAGKQPYLNLPFFVIRGIVYFVVWSLTAWYFRRLSRQQDQSGDIALTLRMERRSGPAMVAFALTATFFAVDVLMSRDPHWYSTIFGVYLFSGSAVGFFALLPLIILLLQKSGYVLHAVTREHYHDLGKLVFAFVVFWAYIAFSQYMLMWYANIPEETVWYLRRQTGAWAGFSLVLLGGHFLIPFWLLISRRAKRQRIYLAGTAVWVLIMHWLDVYWLVMPEAGGNGLGFSLLHVLCFVGLGGLMIAAVTFNLGRAALIPLKDPRLDESLSFENV